MGLGYVMKSIQPGARLRNIRLRNRDPGSTVSWRRNPDPENETEGTYRINNINMTIDLIKFANVLLILSHPHLYSLYGDRLSFLSYRSQLAVAEFHHQIFQMFYHTYPIQLEV